MKGYSGTRLEDIAKEAGVTRGAIYWHFENKTRLYEELIYESYLNYGNLIDRIIESNDTPVAKITRIMRDTLVLLEKDSEFRGVEEILFFKTESVEPVRDVFLDISKFVKKLRAKLSELIVEGIKIGEINPKIDPEIAALAIVSYLSGLEIAWLSDAEDFSLEETVDRLIAFPIDNLVRR